MGYKKIDIVNIILLIVIGLFIFAFSYPSPQYVTGWLIGGVAGIVDFLLIRFSLSQPFVIKSSRYSTCKKIRYIMMGILFVLSALYPKISNIICLLLGYLVNKVSIVICEGFKSKKGSVKENDYAK